MSEAKPCPFCGGTGLDTQTSTTDREGTPLAVICTECGAVGPWAYLSDDALSDAYNDTDYAARLTGWNDRPGSREGAEHG